MCLYLMISQLEELHALPAKMPKCSPQTVKIVEIMALVFALCIVIGLFSLPVVFYYLMVS